MSSTTLHRLGSASAAIEEAARLQRAAQAPRLRWRHVVRLIDLAIGQCEATNLVAAPPGKGMGPPPGLPVPAMAAVMVEWLQTDLGESSRRPGNNQEALDELFRLHRAQLDRYWQGVRVAVRERSR
jgi:hypothetical protein